MSQFDPDPRNPNAMYAPSNDHIYFNAAMLAAAPEMQRCALWHERGHREQARANPLRVSLLATLCRFDQYATLPLEIEADLYAAEHCGTETLLNYRHTTAERRDYVGMRERIAALEQRLEAEQAAMRKAA
jgi:hypothetical protein